MLVHVKGFQLGSFPNASNSSLAHASQDPRLQPHHVHRITDELHLPVVVQIHFALVRARARRPTRVHCATYATFDGAEAFHAELLVRLGHKHRAWCHDVAEELVFDKLLNLVQSLHVSHLEFAFTAQLMCLRLCMHMLRKYTRQCQIILQGIEPRCEWTWMPDSHTMKIKRTCAPRCAGRYVAMRRSDGCDGATVAMTPMIPARKVNATCSVCCVSVCTYAGISVGISIKYSHKLNLK